jgi:predicted RecA/RadA family phage recombinase
MKTYYKSDEIIDYTNAGSAIASDDVVQIGDMLGIAMDAIAATTGVGPVLVRGIAKVTKYAGEAWTQGQTIYYHATNKFTTTATESAVRAGCAAIAAGTGVNGYVMLNSPFNADVGVQSAHIADPASAAALTQVSLADGSGGTAAASITAIGGTFSAGTITVIKNSFASVLARLAEIKVDVAAVRTGSEANNTAIDSTLAALETFKVVAAS